MLNGWTTVSVVAYMRSPLSFFQALKGMAATFRVTTSQITKTSAERRLPSTDSVLTMLKWVERHLSRRKPTLESNSYRRGSTQLAKHAMQMEMSMSNNVDTSPTDAKVNSND